jgi:hypothetical protein
MEETGNDVSEQSQQEDGEEPGTPNPEPRIPNPAEEGQERNPGQPRELPPLTWAGIRQGARVAMRELFQNALTDPSSDAYHMLEIMCLNELVEAQLKTREFDAVEVLRARNQAKELEVKAARAQSQNKLVEMQAEKLRLQIRVLEDKFAQIREKAEQAGEAKKGGRPFDYERALNQISAVIGLRGGEEFLHDEQEAQPS